jgi:hypothetical protein
MTQSRLAYGRNNDVLLSSGDAGNLEEQAFRHLTLSSSAFIQRFVDKR